MARVEPGIGSFVELRGRPWLVENAEDRDGGLRVLTLSCVADDAQGEPLSVLWHAEVGARVLDDDPWSAIGRDGTDDATVFAAFLRTLKWRTATAADRDLFQAPFRAGIRLDSYQLLPLRKALRLPRVNMLIADDVGLGKTIEAGLIVREMLLRRRIDYIVVAAPPAMTLQWQDEMEAKFGLTFHVIDRERIAALRRTHGFGVNPWATGSRFIVSHRLLTDEAYVAGMRDLLTHVRPRALLIVDEAHHAAPASGAAYAVDSQFTKAMRELAPLFQHRLFLTATPHNGHSNSFSALLEMLDPQRFTRGVEVRPGDLDAIMVRRLKVDLRRLGEAFPERKVEPIPIETLPVDTPELVLARMLAAYGELRERRLAGLPRAAAAQGRLVFVGLQQRLLSSIAAFARTLKIHRQTLDSLAERIATRTAAEAYVQSPAPEELPLDADEGEVEASLAEDQKAAAEAATVLGVAGADAKALQAEIAAVDAMLALAESHAAALDARVRWLVDWIGRNMLVGRRWNERRLILFTEYEDTRRWLERRLGEFIAETDRAEERIGVFSGLTGTDRREAIKQAFNGDPGKHPIRILICTDAAREGINLQTRCYDLVHIDLPWNPARLEQRNGRIDRKLQPAPIVYCRYFRYEQREEDIVLDALVRKTETIRTQLGSAGTVIEERIAKRLSESGIMRGKAPDVAKAIDGETDAARLRQAQAEMNDEEQARHARLLREMDDLRRALERSEARVGVDPDQLQHVVATALDRAQFSLDEARGEPAGAVQTYKLDPGHPAFAGDPIWADAFDDLRTRRRRRAERIGEWRRDAPPRAVAFRPPVLPDGRDAPDVVQLHLEHRLVRRLLSRFLSQGFQAGLQRATAVIGPGAQPRAILLGRIALYGPAAARLHEEILPVAAIWTEADRDRRPLRALGGHGEETTLDQLERALDAAKPPPPAVIARLRAFARRDVADLLPALEARAKERIDEARKQLAERGEAEAKSLALLLEDQRRRIAKAIGSFDQKQLELPGIADAERAQKRADRRYWEQRQSEIERELQDEPARLRASFEIRATRLEPVGLVYLWPATG
jgi:SNF2 family DNA or RNA helicase